MKVNRKQADITAEAYIKNYIEFCGAENRKDIENLLELLISKSSLAISKHCGVTAALDVAFRTLDNIE